MDCDEGEEDGDVDANDHDAEMNKFSHNDCDIIDDKTI